MIQECVDLKARFVGLSTVGKAKHGVGPDEATRGSFARILDSRVLRDQADQHPAKRAPRVLLRDL